MSKEEKIEKMLEFMHSYQSAMITYIATLKDEDDEQIVPFMMGQAFFSLTLNALNWAPSKEECLELITLAIQQAVEEFKTLEKNN